MARKIKPNNIVEEAVDQLPMDEVSSKSQSFQRSSLSEEQKAKLEEYDNMQKALSDAALAQSELEAKLEEYIQKLQSFDDVEAKLSAKDAEINMLKSEIADLKRQLNEAKASKIEAKELRDTVDQYLMKISELTFENAKLTSQLDELDAQMKSSSTVYNQKKFQPGVQNDRTSLARPNTDAYNPYLNNGYQSW